MILTELVKELLFPRKCILCGSVLTGNELDLCHDCRTGAPVFDEERRVSGIEAVCILWYYEGAVRESLLWFKFHNRPGYAEGYGRMLAMRIAGELHGIDLITWVPVSGKRRRERGYDQSELLARAVSKELGIPARATLKKVRHNPAQSGITDLEQRKANVQDAYQVLDSAAVKDKRVLLIDDILTTGATAAECARMLREAGAAEVSLAAVASGRKQKNE